MGKHQRRSGTSKFFQESTNIIYHVERKHWNRAVALIDGAPRSKSFDDACIVSQVNLQSHRRTQRFGIRNSVHGLVFELRQALLRHDWHSVCQLYLCLLDTAESFKALSNKIMMVLLLSNPASDSQIFKDFCSMALGLKGDEVNVFLKTICTLPKEIPRGFLEGIKDKLYVKADSGREIANAYLNASLQEASERKDEVDDTDLFDE